MTVPQEFEGREWAQQWREMNLGFIAVDVATLRMEAEDAMASMRALRVAMDRIHRTDEEGALTTACLVVNIAQQLQQSHGLITRTLAEIERNCNMIIRMQVRNRTDQHDEIEMHPGGVDADDDDMWQEPPDHFQEEPDSWLDVFVLPPPPDGGGNLN